MWRNTAQGYGLISIGLHWLMAVAIFGLFGLGLWMVELTYYSSWYQTAPAIHKAIGVILMLLLLARLLWRGFNPTPAAHSNHRRVEQIGAKVGHLLLYGGIALVLVSGYLISTADGRGIDLFGLVELPALISGIDQQEEIAGQIHFYAAWGLVLAAIGHGLAAVKHHIFDKDTTLIRMVKPTHS
ncbi:cytochrome b [uncultured Ferrimonas sp.]|uniref:cytochrome b n=1 Tax=uncultured Ferrimonas sp. TaxID=432640 RepID=UPI0026257241|nr:cytochrome b [uncultured Ferrimonas sp.]